MENKTTNNNEFEKKLEERYEFTDNFISGILIIRQTLILLGIIYVAWKFIEAMIIVANL